MHKRNKLGLSLVELIVAMSILSIGIVFILRSFLNTISALDTSIYYIKSMNVLQIKAAELELETAVSGGIEVKDERLSNLVNGAYSSIISQAAEKEGAPFLNRM